MALKSHNQPGAKLAFSEVAAPGAPDSGRPGNARYAITSSRHGRSRHCDRPIVQNLTSPNPPNRSHSHGLLANHARSAGNSPWQNSSCRPRLPTWPPGFALLPTLGSAHSHRRWGSLTNSCSAGSAAWAASSGLQTHWSSGKAPRGHLQSLPSWPRRVSW